jgi:hypothetical protein
MSKTLKLSTLEDAIRTLLIGEIQRNGEFALLAYGDFINYLGSMKTGDSHLLDRFWFSVESFLIAVANISKILWPSRPNRCVKCGFQPDVPSDVSARRQDLRKFLTLDDSSPIASRKFRNHFEHYDFRIEEWAKKAQTKGIIDSNIGPPTSVIIHPPNKYAYMRNFDPSKFILHFRDEEYEIKPVVTAIQDLLNKVRGSHH